MPCSLICAQGWDPDHGTARGPMAEVASNLSSVNENDVRAIATYMADVFGAPTSDRIQHGEAVIAQAKVLNPSPTQVPGRTSSWCGDFCCSLRHLP